MFFVIYILIPPEISKTMVTNYITKESGYFGTWHDNLPPFFIWSTHKVYMLTRFMFYSVFLVITGQQSVNSLYLYEQLCLACVFYTVY